jgi:hypothetical protein
MMRWARLNKRQVFIRAAWWLGESRQNYDLAGNIKTCSISGPKARIRSDSSAASTASPAISETV